MKLLNFAFLEVGWIKQMSNIDNILPFPTSSANCKEAQAVKDFNEVVENKFIQFSSFKSSMAWSSWNN